ncbi:MAG TPA: hypothetical protein VFK27_03120, partial [Bacillales bacterium]|nr:hypothetical protein [Bacillales bacterium]
MQLLALTIQNYGGLRGWMKHFDGKHHYFNEYFTQLLENEPREIRNFLLRTAVMEDFDDSYCLALSDKEKFREVINRHWFVIKEGGKYRYEPLFRAFLQKEFRAMTKATRQMEYARASAWCAGNGKPADAVDLALLAGDGQKAASLIIQFVPEFLKGDSFDEPDRWTGLLNMVHGRKKAKLLLFYCWISYLKRNFAGLSEFLEETGQFIAEEELPNAYKGELLLLRSLTSLAIKDIEGAKDYGDAAFSILQNGGVYFDLEINMNAREALLTRGGIGLDGRPGSAVSYYRHLRKYRTIIPEAMKGYGLATFADALYEANKIEEAWHASQKALEIAGKYENASMLIPAVVVHTKILQKKRNFAKALAVI